MSKVNLSKVTVILRGYTYEQIKCVAQSLIGTSINNIEITLNSPNVFNSIKNIKNDFPELNVGAGTVCTLEDTKKSIESGVDFILSPINLSKESIDLCNKNDVVCVPAAMTPSEIYKMFEYGADIVKVFPATTVGAKFFKDVQAPLGNLELMAVGGVNGDNAKEFLDNKCNYLGIGSGIFEKKDIIDKNTDKLKLSLNKFIKNMEV